MWVVFDRIDLFLCDTYLLQLFGCILPFHFKNFSVHYCYREQVKILFFGGDVNVYWIKCIVLFEQSIKVLLNI